LVTDGHGQVIAAAQQVERELHLPSHWLNEQATVFLSERREFSFFRTYPSEGQFGLRVLMATPEYLLSMKLLSSRSHVDQPDAVRLARLLDITTEDALMMLLKRYYPEEKISEERIVRVRELVRQINAATQP
jgi:hypothetical protein